MQNAQVFLRGKQEYVSIPINPQFAELADDLLLQKWQKMINLVADILAVKAGLIMRVTEENMEVFLRSENEGNPYPSDGKDHLGHGLYCETVLGEDQELYIDNSLHSDRWKDNPDVKLQMISYYGLPIKNPDGSFFGTICALDNKTMAESQKYRDLLDQFRQSIETDLQLILNVKQMSELLKFLTLVTEASSSFVAVSNNESFEQAVEDTLASFGVYFAVDRSSLFHCSKNTSEIIASHEWNEQPALRESSGLREHLSLDSLPWLKARLLQLQPVEIPAVKALPAAAEAEKNYYLKQNIQSLIYLPLSDNHDRLKGFMRFDAIRSPRTWSEEQVGMLQVLAEIVGNAILRFEAEEEVHNLNEALEQRVKERTVELEAVNKELIAFTYAVSHDFRAPLRALDAFSASLESSYKDQFDEKGLHYLNRIRNAAVYMSDLVDGMLSLTRVTRAELNKTEVNLGAVAADVLRTLQKNEPERTADVSIADHLFVHGDPQFMKMLMKCLLGNAWKFSAQETHPKIEVGRDTVNDDDVYFVRDNGVGFNMAYADKLFGAFERLHGVGEFPGTGIGLATVQRIINRHGGRIWAESEVGKGATFYFTLPG